jgi:cell division protein FtsW
MDKTLLITSVLLLIIGLIMVFSASNVTSFMKFKTTPYHFFNRQLLFLVVSIIFSFLIIRVNSKAYGYLSSLVLIGVVGLLIAVLLSGKMVNEARSWISILGIQFQPSELAKVTCIIWIASLYTMKSKLDFKSYLLLVGVVGAITILIILQPDMGTALIFLAIVFIMFLSLGFSKKIKRNTIFVIIGGVVFLAFLVLTSSEVRNFFDRQISRMTSFGNPCSEEKFYTTGNQLCNGYIAFNNGGLTGLGLGNSTQKYLYLPEAYTDFIFAITVEELGLVASIGILLLMFIVLWRIFIIGKRANTDRGRMMCYGIFWYILLHIVINLGGATGLIPLTGVPLPFLSYGGTFLICLVVSLTVVQRVAIETKNA